MHPLDQSSIIRRANLSHHHARIAHPSTKSHHHRPSIVTVTVTHSDNQSPFIVNTCDVITGSISLSPGSPIIINRTSHHQPSTFVTVAHPIPFIRHRHRRGIYHATPSTPPQSHHPPPIAPPPTHRPPTTTTTTITTHPLPQSFSQLQLRPGHRPPPTTGPPPPRTTPAITAWPNRANNRAQPGHRNIPPINHNYQLSYLSSPTIATSPSHRPPPGSPSSFNQTTDIIAPPYTYRYGYRHGDRVVLTPDHPYPPITIIHPYHARRRSAPPAPVIAHPSGRHWSTSSFRIIIVVTIVVIVIAHHRPSQSPISSPSQTIIIIHLSSSGRPGLGTWRTGRARAPAAPSPST